MCMNKCKRHIFVVESTRQLTAVCIHTDVKYKHEYEYEYEYNRTDARLDSNKRKQLRKWVKNIQRREWLMQGDGNEEILAAFKKFQGLTLT